MTNASTDLVYVVEGCHRAVFDDPYNWKPVAAFRYRSDADRYIRYWQDVNRESALIDQMEVRLQNSSESGEPKK